MAWWFAVSAGAVCTFGLIYGWFEAGWLRTRVLEVELAELPRELDGLRIAHLSDFHLGMPSLGRIATERAVSWVAERKPELVCVTGDLVSHPRGEPLLRTLLERLGRPYVVLGNHDVAVTRDPFSRAAELDDLRRSVLLRDEAVDVVVRGSRVQLVGVDPLTFAARTAVPSDLADPAADLRILLCHYPDVVRRGPVAVFDLVLVGHLHAGQLALPYPGGRIAVSHPRERETAGLFRVAGTTLHISPGLGTTFVPFRFLARPEVTELVLRRA